MQQQNSAQERQAAARCEKKKPKHIGKIHAIGTAECGGKVEPLDPFFSFVMIDARNTSLIYVPDTMKMYSLYSFLPGNLRRAQSRVGSIEIPAFIACAHNACIPSSRCHGQSCSYEVWLGYIFSHPCLPSHLPHSRLHY